jgi:hypothetical protein
MNTYVQLYHHHYDQSAPDSIGTNIEMLVVARLFAFIDNLLAFLAAILTRYLLSYYYTFIRYTRAGN